MLNFDLRKYRNNKKAEIILISVLFVIAILTIFHSVSVIKAEEPSSKWVQSMELIVEQNKQIIDKTKQEMQNDLKNLSSPELTSRKEEELNALSQGDYVILKKSDEKLRNLKSVYFTNAIIQSKKLGDKYAGLSYINEYKKIVEKNKFVHDYDKLINEIEDTGKMILKEDIK